MPGGRLCAMVTSNELPSKALQGAASCRLESFGPVPIAIVPFLIRPGDKWNIGRGTRQGYLIGLTRAQSAQKLIL